MNANPAAEHVRECLKQVFDPELGVNIIDLGLVYDIAVLDDQIDIRMTLTTPGCPMHDTIVGAVHRALAELPKPMKVNVDVVWEPRWTPEHMSEAAKEQLDYF